MAKRTQKNSKKQKNNKALFILCLLILLGILIGVFFFQNENNRKSAGIAGQEITVQVQTIKEDEDTNVYSLALTYPYLSGFTNSRAQEIINTKIKELIVATAIRFKHDVNQIQTEFEQEEYKNSLTIDYQVVQANDQIVSIAFTVSDYTSGAAHPNSYTLPFNYSLVTNRELILTRIFKEPARVIPVLSIYATEDLLAKYPDFKDFIQEGAAPHANNFQKFVLTPDAFILIFDPYHVGPYAAGTINVSVPLSKLSSYIKNPL